MTAELDSENQQLQVQPAEAYSAALAEKERDVADLRDQLARGAGASGSDRAGRNTQEPDESG